MYWVDRGEQNVTLPLAVSRLLGSIGGEYIIETRGDKSRRQNSMVFHRPPAPTPKHKGWADFTSEKWKRP
jgi:hypothetical protein